MFIHMKICKNAKGIDYCVLENRNAISEILSTLFYTLSLNNKPLVILLAKVLKYARCSFFFNYIQFIFLFVLLSLSNICIVT